AYHHRRSHRPQPGGAGAADPGIPGDVRRVHIPPAVSHRRAVRLWPAGDPGCQLCLCSQYAGHRRLRRRSGGHCRRHDRGRHRGCAGGRVRQEDPPAVPAGHHRHGGVHHWPLPLPYRHQLHGRRHRQ
ncbi:PrgI family protein, partial [Dysosmobacter welbionis]